MTIPGIPFTIPMNPSPQRGSLMPIKTFPREPLLTDVKYPIGFVAIIGENPLTGNQGDLWYLSYFNNGQAIWKKFSSDPDEEGIKTITTDDGTPPIVPDTDGNISLVGGRQVSVTGQGPGSVATISNTGNGLDWYVVTDATLTMAANSAYYANNGSGVSFTLPSTANVGDLFIVSAMNAGGWTILVNGGQTIRYGTTGGATSIASQNIGDSITLSCCVADAEFMTINSFGNLDVI
jgi:hypothetical protein